MISRKFISACAIVAVIIAASLAGCSPPSQSTSAPSVTSPPGPTSTPTGAPVATPPAPVLVVGQVVDAATAANLPANLPAGQKAYKMADGSLIVVQKDKPLPAQVIADAAGPAQKAQDAVPASGVQKQNAAGQQANDVVAMVANDVARDVFIKTGKSAVVVYRVYEAQGETPDTYQWLWISTASLGKATVTKEPKVAQAQAYTTSQAVPAENYVVIVLD